MEWKKEENGFYSLENETLKITLLPRRGGKITSLYDKKKEEELLFQNPHKEFGAPLPGADFSNYDASGFDDAFPNIDAEEVVYREKTFVYSDHGDIWTLPLIPQISGDCMILSGETERYFYEKSIKLEKNILRVKYRIKNRSDVEFPCFYTLHCLFRCEEDLRISFPAGTNKVENTRESERLGKAGTLWDFPVAGETDLSRVRPKSAATCEKFYAAGPVREGRCGLYYPRMNTTVEIVWDAKILPYLGFWVTEGGFRGDYNCALEPSSGYYDAVSRALNNRKLWILKPGEAKEFEIGIFVKDGEMI